MSIAPSRFGAHAKSILGLKIEVGGVRIPLKEREVWPSHQCQKEVGFILSVVLDTHLVSFTLSVHSFGYAPREFPTVLQQRERRA
jgi:hypothetical protein